MIKLFPKNLIYRGAVEAVGFLFTAELTAKNEQRRRVLLLWQTGAEVFNLNGDLFLRLAQPQLIRASRAFGLPVAANGKHLLTFTISENEAQKLNTENESLIFWKNGELKFHELAKLEREPVENWFDVSDFAVIQTESLGVVREKPVLIVAEAKKSIALRDDLALPPPNPQMAAMLKMLREKQFTNTAKPGERLDLSGISFGNSTGWNLWESASSLWQSLTGEKSQNPNFGGLQNQNQEASWAEKAAHNLRNFLIQAAIKSRLASLVGRQQADYLNKMMNLFENGDLQEALKYAIPLEDMQTLKNGLPQTAFLGFLRPRSDLSFGGAGGQSSSAVNLQDEWFEHLRTLYRQSFERLEAAGRIEEAAFVLAELLKDNAQAVEFLEKHGKLRLAAELAEARDLPKDTIVRQWFLAGDKKRAVRLAILHNSFAFAVPKLESQNHPQAAELRSLWAHSLASGGNYAAAIDVAANLENERANVLDWIEKVLQIGGVPAARMLVRKIVLSPESFHEIREQTAKILDSGTPDSVVERAVLAREIVNAKANQEIKILAKITARAVLRDAAANSNSLTAGEFQNLVGTADDQVFRADLPQFPVRTGNFTVSETFNFRVSASDKGANQIKHAVVLPDNKIAVALGEAGVNLLNPKGKIVAHFDQPAEKIILSDNGDRAILLMRRGNVWRISKIDFLTRRAKHWCDAEISAFANDFNGNLWFVGVRDEFYAIDATAADFEAVWRVPEIGGKVVSVARSAAVCKFLTDSPQQFEKWTYQLPNLYLRDRKQTPHNNLEIPVERQTAISSGSFSVTVINENGEFKVFIFEHEKLLHELDLPRETIKCAAPQVFGERFAVITHSANETRIWLYNAQTLRLTASFTLEAATTAAIHLTENLLTVTDDGGRVLIFDAHNNILRQNLRL